MHAARKGISAILGLVFLALGLIPLLNLFGVIAWTIPAVAGMVLWVLAVLGGLFLLIDALKEQQEARHALSVPSGIIGLVVLALGLIPLLGTFGVIAWGLPAFVFLATDFIFVAAGLFLLIGATQGF